jgi:hypothetical protein
MMQRIAFLSASGMGLLLLSACHIGVSESRIKAAEPAPGVDGKVTPAPMAPVAKEVCPKGVQVAGDGVIDHMEDGNTQIDTAVDRDGYWWTATDKVGSTLEPSEGFTPVPGGPDGSNLAIHVSGNTADSDQAWGANVGFNLSSAGLYDASRYVGVRFKARVAHNTSKRVHFKIGDVNTHQDAGVCDDCWNHFGKDMTLSENWVEYTLFFEELTQAAGWGKPRPDRLTAAQIYSMDISIDKGQTFDIWLDDFEFIECQK